MQNDDDVMRAWEQLVARYRAHEQEEVLEINACTQRLEAFRIARGEAQDAMDKLKQARAKHAEKASPGPGGDPDQVAQVEYLGVPRIKDGPPRH